MDYKKIIGIGGAIGSFALGCFGVKYISKNPPKYSDKWFKSISDAALDAEREIVRKEFCASGKDFSKAVNLQNLLHVFDEEIRRRRHA